MWPISCFRTKMNENVSACVYNGSHLLREMETLRISSLFFLEGRIYTV